MSKDKTEELAEVIADFFNALESACVNAKMQIAKLYNISLGQEKPTKTATQTAELPAGVDIAGLPWKSYKTKEVAKPEEAGWIFSNIKGAESLVSLLKIKGEKCVVGEFEYQIQGDKGQFIARRPVKKK